MPGIDKLTISDAKNAAKEGQDIAKMHEVPARELKEKVMARLQKEPLHTLLVDDLTHRYKSQNPDKLTPDQMTRLRDIIIGTATGLSAGDKPLVMKYMRSFSDHVSSKAVGTMGSKNAWKSL